MRNQGFFSIDRRQCRFLLCAAAILCLFAAQIAHAMRPAQPCAEPAVFSDAAINVVILPYSSEGATARPLGDSAQKFTLLMQFEIVFSLLKYESIGVTRLIASPSELQSGQCSPDVVLAKLLSKTPGEKGRLKKGHGLILVWGGFYEEGKDLYVQTYVRFLRAGMREDFVLPVKDVRFTGRLPLQSVALPPQLITAQDLEEIAREFKDRAVFRDSPDERAPGSNISFDSFNSVSKKWTLYVTEVRQEWMHLESFGTGPRGWVRAGGPASEFVRLKQPKFSFIEGVGGYLRRFSEGTAKPSKATWEYADRALERFITTTSGDGLERETATESPSLALASCMRGVLMLHGGESITLENSKKALPYFRNALKYMSYSADLRNLELQTRLYLAYQSSEPNLNATQIARDFSQAASLEPDNASAVSNLESYYQLMLTSGPPPNADPKGVLLKEELSRRLYALSAVQLPGDFL